MNAIIGAKKGNKTPRKPRISPDSAQSKTYIKILYGLSEGEIEGFANGLQSVYLEETPVQDGTGNTSFDLNIDFRHGTNDQEYIEGYPAVESETAIDVELTDATPWVRAFSNLDLDAVRIRIRFGALREQNASNGDVKGITIEYAFELQTDGGVWSEVLRTKVSDKTSADYERAHRIDLPRADSGWLIRLRRITPNSNSEYISDKMFIAAVTEVIDAKLRYPNTALLGLQYDAETFGNVAKVAVDLKGLKIKVPSNYNPQTRQYIGMWDGTFIRAYSNNPAWIYYDICTSGRYGIGERINAAMLDKWSLYRLGQYCDQLVPDGLGGEEPRFTCNVYLQGAEDAFSVLTKLAGVFRAISYWDGNNIICDADIPQDTYFTYTRANVIDGQFEYSGTRARDRHNVVKVAWDNPANHYKTEYEFVRDEQAIGKTGQVRILDLDAWGCTSRGQAQRAGQWALKSEQLETRTVTFKVGLDGYIPQPGRVIEIADELFAGRANGGRVSAVSVDQTSITLDRDNVVAVSGDRLIINGEDGQAQTRIIQSINGRVVSVTHAFDSVAVQNVWVIDAQDLATMKFRVMSITQDEKHQFTINALQYNLNKYDAIDSGAYFDDVPISIVNPTIQEPVTNVVVSSEDRIDQGINIATMIITWAQAKAAVKYLVEWRKDDGTWIKLPITGNNSAEVQGIYAGQYQARVTAISAFEIASLPTYSVLTALSGKQGTPPQLAFIQATGILFGMDLKWGFPAVGALDTAYTEIQVSPDGSSNIAALGMFAYPTNTHKIQGLQPNLIQFYRARLVDRIGNVGPWSSWTSSTTSADASAVLDILSGKITESQLHQDLQTKIDKIDAAEGDIADLIVAVQNVENGVTQERNERIAGDNQVLNQLTIYKVSNDQAVAAVVEEVEILTTEQGALSTKIDGVFAQVNPPLIGSESDLIGNNAGYAGVWSEQSARIEGDLVQAKRTDTVQTELNGNIAAVQEVTQSVNGLYAQKYIKLDVNGKVAGWGGANTGIESNFIVNFDSFAIGSGGSAGYYPFIFRSTPYTDPNTGTVFPVGAYMKAAFMDYASIDTAHIKQLAVKSAQIDDGAITTAKIGDLQVDTLKIKDNAVTVPVGIKLVTPIQKNTQRSATVFTGGDAVILDTSNYFGDIISLSLNRSGGKCQISGYVYVDNVCASAWRSNGTTVSNAPKTMYCGVVLYRNGSPIFIGRVASSSEITNDVAIFNGAVQLPTIIDDAYTGNVQYSIRVGWSTTISDAGLMIRPWNAGNASVLTATLSVLELKK
ncbi:host specificity protein J [Acinetobacter junii]|uniref:host specificity protein J n=1 Tax=Acinetobacter junii TaxID=40215 RepID=UPI000F66918B|nr:phage tail protein [Acinetobacter junii]QXR26632.1 host specificity protein J [Acinetobacter junii]